MDLNDFTNDYLTEESFRQVSDTKAVWTALQQWFLDYTLPMANQLPVSVEPWKLILPAAVASAARSPEVKAWLESARVATVTSAVNYRQTLSTFLISKGYDLTGVLDDGRIVLLPVPMAPMTTSGGGMAGLVWGASAVVITYTATPPEGHSEDATMNRLRQRTVSDYLSACAALDDAFDSAVRVYREEHQWF